MRKAFVALAVVLMLSTAASAQTPAPKLLSFHVGGGIGLPMTPEDFQDFWKIGFHGKAGIGLNIAGIEGLQLIGKVEYHVFSFDWDELGDAFDFDPDGFDGGDLRALMFGADLRLGMNMSATNRLSPYLLAGLGAANLTASDLEVPVDAPEEVPVPTDPDETDLYLNGGVGFSFGVGQTARVFIEGRYVNIFTDGDDLGFIPLTVGVSF